MFLKYNNISKASVLFFKCQRIENLASLQSVGLARIPGHLTLVEWLLLIGPNSLQPLPSFKTDRRIEILFTLWDFALPSNLCPSIIEKHANLVFQNWEEKPFFKALQLRLISSHTFASKKKKRFSYHFPRNIRISLFFLSGSLSLILLVL